MLVFKTTEAIVYIINYVHNNNNAVNLFETYLVLPANRAFMYATVQRECCRIWLFAIFLKDRCDH